jgi:hypothetical protein
MSKKGILKHTTPLDVPEKHLAWDEAAIAQDDLQRGGKQKITEPKTYVSLECRLNANKTVGAVRSFQGSSFRSFWYELR